jgi:hypothetical protein
VRWERGNRAARIHLLLIDWPKSSSYAGFDTNICAALLSSRRQNSMNNNMIHMFDLSRPRGALFLRSKILFGIPHPRPRDHQYSAFSFFSLSVFFNSLLLARSSMFPSAQTTSPRPYTGNHSLQRDFQNRRCFFTWMTPVCLTDIPSSLLR